MGFYTKFCWKHPPSENPVVSLLGGRWNDSPRVEAGAFHPDEGRAAPTFKVAELGGSRECVATLHPGLIFQRESARLMVRLRSPQEPCPTRQRRPTDRQRAAVADEQFNSLDSYWVARGEGPGFVRG